MVKVLNFGSLNLDYVYTVNHFVRAGETLASSERSVFCGGKGLNQSIALARAGAQTYHAGAIGPDGYFLVNMLKESNVNVEFTKQIEFPTGHAIIQREPNGQNCILLYGGANQNIKSEDIDKVLSHFSSGDYIVLQNEINKVDEIIRKAKFRGMKVVLNPSPMDRNIHLFPLDMVDIFILNEIEASDICSEPDHNKLLGTLCKLFPKASIVLTLGEKGSIYKDPSLPVPILQGIYKVNVVDTTAAGDTFTGYFITSIISGKSAAEALDLASKASAIAVARPGAAPSIPTLNEVLSTVF